MVASSVDTNAILRDRYVFEICDDIISRKSAAALKRFLTSSNRAKLQELDLIIKDFIRVKRSVADKYNALKGESLELRIKGEIQNVIVAGCDTKYLQYSFNIGTRIINAKIELRDIAVDEQLRGIDLKKEALALYAAFSYASLGNSERAAQCALHTGLLEKGLFKALKVDPDSVEPAPLFEQNSSMTTKERMSQRRLVGSENDSGKVDDGALFSYLIGVQQPHAVAQSDITAAARKQLYHGTPDQLWVADHIVSSMNGDVLKLAMGKKHLERQGLPSSGYESLTQLAEHPIYKKILDLPYRVMYFWAHGKVQFNYFNRAKEEQVYKEFYDFTCHLLKEYNNSGKTFMIGNWEGDWLLGAKVIGPEEDCDADRIERMIDWMNIKGKAIEDAKRDTRHKNVNVNFYIEVNHVNLPQTNGVERMINSVVPKTKYTDYVSISSYDMQNLLNWPKPRTADTLRDQVFADLDYVQSMLPPRNVGGKRVLIGEIGYTITAIKKQYRIQDDEQAEIIQARLALTNAMLNLEWGCDMWLWWAFHNNETNASGDFLGFGIIDQQLVKKRRLYYEFTEYYTWAKKFTADTRKRKRRLPTQSEMRSAAVKWLKHRITQL